jgi:glutamyl-tRNA reductase
MLNILLVGWNHRTVPDGLLGRLTVGHAARATGLDLLTERAGCCEAVILSTCNRVEYYLCMKSELTSLVPVVDCVVALVAELTGVPTTEFRTHLYVHRQEAAIQHLFRVASGLDSLVLGETQIVAQLKDAYETAKVSGHLGPLFHALFQQANHVAKIVRTKTGIAQGRMSVAAIGVEYLREICPNFDDKTILVIGAGQMGRLTTSHLRQLRAKCILVTNRTFDKARKLAHDCGGQVVPWTDLNLALAQADFILSATGAQHPIVTMDRWETILGQRKKKPVFILDMAVPCDFDPRIHDGDQTRVLGIDDLKRIQATRPNDRLEHVGPAEAIVEQQKQRFLKDWERRRVGPVIDDLTRDLEQKLQDVLNKVSARLNGKLTEAERQYVEDAFRRYRNIILHGPITVLREEVDLESASSYTLLDAIRRLFGLEE